MSDDTGLILLLRLQPEQPPWSCPSTCFVLPLCREMSGGPHRGGISALSDETPPSTNHAAPGGTANPPL